MCKITKKRLLEDFNSKIIKTTIEQNGSLKKVKKRTYRKDDRKLPAFVTVMDKRLQIKMKYSR